jgi:hypothetical protein
MNVRFRNCWRRNSPFRRLSVAALVGGAALCATGCAAFNVKPWEHDLLAQPAMQFGAYPLEASMDDHIYFSKEASSGGRTYAGGGCGCN